MARIIIDEYGDKLYYNDKGKIHRIDGPAVIANSGNIFWKYNGEFHRKDGPAVRWSDGTIIWFTKGLRGPRKYDRPSEERPNGHKLWWGGFSTIWPELK